MSKSKSVFIPAIIVVIASLLLIAYSFYADSNGNPNPFPSGEGGEGGMPPQGGRKEGLEPFKLLGTISVVCGAISFTWLRLKRSSHQLPSL